MVRSVTMHDGFVRSYTTPLRQGMIVGEDGTRYAGVMADPSRGVSSQGNTLASSEVVQKPLDTYLSGGLQHTARPAYSRPDPSPAATSAAIRGACGRTSTYKLEE